MAFIITHQNTSHVTILGCNNDKTQKQIVACCLLGKQRQKDAEKCSWQKRSLNRAKKKTLFYNLCVYWTWGVMNIRFKQILLGFIFSYNLNFVSFIFC